MTTKPTSKTLARTEVVPSEALAQLEPLAKQVRELIGEAKSPRTRAAYKGDWARFELWCTGHGLSALPPHPENVAAHLADLANEGLKVSSIERALAGIAFYFRASGFDWTTPKGVTEMMKGLRRRLGVRPTQKTPAVDAVLHAMVATFGVDLRGLRNRALFTVGWVGAFRRSDVVSLDVEDVRFVPEGLIVLLRRSKTDQEGEGEEKGLPLAGNPAVCPVRSLRAWLQASDITTGPIFRAINAQGHVRDARLSDRSVADFIKQAALAAGLDPSEFSGHSLRSGFATTAAQHGVPLHEIMSQTGHKSERVARGYVRHATLFQRNAAKGLL
jgi:site-specific recombinase XerD